VARKKPQRATVIVVQGRRDWISRLFFKAPDHVIDCAHLDYLKLPAFAEICRTTIERESTSTP
jgi:hypothetical protein